MAKAKYCILNADSVLGLVYEDEKLGRTLVLNGEINNDFEIQIVNMDGTPITQSDLKEYLLSLLPIKK